MKHKLVQCPGIAKPYFDLGGMHVHIHCFRFHLQEEYESRMPVQMEYVLIGCAQGMRDELIAYKAAIDIEILSVARSPGIGW